MISVPAIESKCYLQVSSASVERDKQQQCQINSNINSSTPREVPIRSSLHTLIRGSESDDVEDVMIVERNDEPIVIFDDEDAKNSTFELFRRTKIIEDIFNIGNDEPQADDYNLLIITRQLAQNM